MWAKVGKQVVKIVARMPGGWANRKTCGWTSTWTGRSAYKLAVRMEDWLAGEQACMKAGGQDVKLVSRQESWWAGKQGSSEQNDWLTYRRVEGVSNGWAGLSATI